MAVPLASSSTPQFIPKGPGIKGGGVAAVGACFGVLASVAVQFAFALASGSFDPTQSVSFFVASELALWVCFFGATMVATRMNGSGSLVTDFGLSWPTFKDTWTGVLGGVIGRLWPLLFVILIVIANGQGFDTPNSTAHRVLGLAPNGAWQWLLIGLFVVVGAPFFEELFFRGLVQGAFTRRVGAVPAIFITALIFSAVHTINEGLLAPVVLLPMALILGYLKHKTGRLAAGMVAHATFNASVFLLFLVPAFR